MRCFSVIFLAILFFFGCGVETKKDYLFTTVDPDQTHVDFINEVKDSEDFGILYYLYFYNGGGVSVGDINNDGLPDLYFTGNQVSNKLYLNKGGFEFEDITEQAGVAGNSDWNTGTTFADVNGDGLLDIYVCSVVGIHGLKGQNELFINNGDLTFSEQAEAFGLGFRNFSTSAAFFDYDNDGDLDLYLLNHSVHTENSYGPSSIRFERNEMSGDKLLENVDGKFQDVSVQAGIFGGANGYGLGIATADFNNDGWTDIYISNDFHEDDYYYINQRNGTFAEVLKEKFSQTSRFSMGNDVGDINQDGFMDLITLDMLPPDEKVLKSSMNDDPVYTHDLKIERLKYHPQYARNMLQINQGGEYFQETAVFSGVEASDWSWSPLFADFDLDGKQDLFISTGIHKRPNDHDYIAYISNDENERDLNRGSGFDQKALEKMPSGEVRNFIFKGEEDLQFSDHTGIWISDQSGISNGSAWADLDLDGDLDLITNNLNEPVGIFRNGNLDSSNYLKIRVKMEGLNSFGLGTKVFSWHGKVMQTKQLFTTRGFQSSSEPIIHFGYGQTEMVDSLLIVWPDNTFEWKYSVPTNQSLEWSPGEIRGEMDSESLFPHERQYFEKVEFPGFYYKHLENNYVDFNRQKLIPYKVSDRGPSVGVKDLNQDGKQDLFFGGAKNQPSRQFFQTSNGFVEVVFNSLYADSLFEEVAVEIADFNLDGKNDIFLVSGGGEYQLKKEDLEDRLFTQNEKGFQKTTLESYYGNGSVVKSFDFDKDGDLDLFIGGYASGNDFGKIPESFLLENRDGVFYPLENQELKEVGMVTDAVWTDFNQDGWTDLVVIGEWMAPKFFQNQRGVLVDKSTEYIEEKLNGLWQRILPFDVNDDGQLDYLIGNWGLNTRFSATEEFPLKMYYGDFDSNGNRETVLAYEKGGVYFTVAGLADLGSQMPFIKKRFTSHSEFAGKSLDEIFYPEELENSQLMTVDVLASGVLVNNNGKFSFQPLESTFQMAPIRAFLKFDFNHDGKEEVLVGGNSFGVHPYQGRLGSFSGGMIFPNASDKVNLGVDFNQKSVRSLEVVYVNEVPYLLAVYNGEEAEFYKMNFWN